MSFWSSRKPPPSIVLHCRMGLLTRAHSCKRPALVTTTFSNYRGGCLQELRLYWNFSFSISAEVSPKNRYEWYFREKWCWIKQTGSDKKIQYLKRAKLKISCGRKSQLPYRVKPWLLNASVWRLSFAFSSILYPTGHETINIQEIFFQHLNKLFGKQYGLLYIFNHSTLCQSDFVQHVRVIWQNKLAFDCTAQCYWVLKRIMLRILIMANKYSW